MKCVAVQAWSLTVRGAERLPRGVGRHLNACRSCRRWLHRLRSLDERVARQEVPSLSESRRSELFARMEERTATATRPRRIPVYRVAGVAALVLVGVGVGLILAPRAADPIERAETAPPEVPRLVRSAGVRELLPRVVDHHLRLAESYDPQQYPDLFGTLAGDLRSGAVRLARDGVTEEIPLFVTLHEQVLRRGLVRSVRALTPERRVEARARVLEHLKLTRQEVEKATRLTPELAAELLRPLEAAANEAVRLLDSKDPMVSSSPVSLTLGAGPASTVVGGLVLSGLTLADENDPLRRAALCRELADQLLQAALVASAGGDAELSERLGRDLTNLVERGVHGNLDRARLITADESRPEQFAPACKRATSALTLLRNGLPFHCAGPSHHGGLHRERARELDQTLKELHTALKDLAEKGKPGPRNPFAREYPGEVKGVDPARRTVRILFGDRSQTVELTYRVASDTRLRVGVLPLPLHRLPVGARVRVKLRDPATLSEIRWDPKPGGPPMR